MEEIRYNQTVDPDQRGEDFYEDQEELIVPSVDVNDMELLKMYQEDTEMMDRLNRKPREEDLKFDCEVCMEPFQESNTFPLSNCEHIFHNQCVKNYLKAEIDQ